MRRFGVVTALGLALALVLSGCPETRSRPHRPSSVQPKKKRKPPVGRRSPAPRHVAHEHPHEHPHGESDHHHHPHPHPHMAGANGHHHPF